MAERCRKCGKPLTADEIGMTKKLISRGAADFLCLDCLADLFGCDREFLQEKIRYFRSMGCTLFPPEEEHNGTQPPGGEKV